MKWLKELWPCQKSRSSEELDVVFEGGPSLDLLYSETKRAFDAQHDQIDKLDAKIGLVLGASGIMLAVLFDNAVGGQERRDLTDVLLSLAVVGVAVSAVCSLVALWVRTFGQVPHPRKVAEHGISADESVTKADLLAGFIKSYCANEAAVKGKVRWLNRAACLLVAAIIVAGIAFIYNSL